MNHKLIFTFCLFLLIPAALKAGTVHIPPSQFLYADQVLESLTTDENYHLFEYLPHDEGGYYLSGASEVNELPVWFNTRFSLSIGDEITGLRCSFGDDDLEANWYDIKAGVSISPFSHYHPDTNLGVGLLYTGFTAQTTDNNGAQALFEFASDPSETWTLMEGWDEGWIGQVPDNYELQFVLNVFATMSVTSSQLRFLGCEVDIDRSSERQCDDVVCGSLETCYEEGGGECACAEPVNEIYISGDQFAAINPSLTTYYPTLSGAQGYFEGCDNMSGSYHQIFAKAPLSSGDQITEVSCDFIDRYNFPTTTDSNENYWWYIGYVGLEYQNYANATSPNWNTTTYLKYWMYNTDSMEPALYENHPYGGVMDPIHTVGSGTYWVLAGLKPRSVSNECDDQLLFGGCTVSYIPADPCENVVCSDEASCNAQTGQCECGAGYSGNGCNCIDVNECETGNYVCGANSSCVNNVGGYDCECDSGYAMNSSGVCVDIDECAFSSIPPCNPVNGSCQNTEGSYICSCNEGFDGDGVTCLNINECHNDSDNECDINASCNDTIGGYTCTCNAWFAGDGFTCEPVADLCDANPCQNNGVCSFEQGDSNYTCTCVGDYSGVNCELEGASQVLEIPEGWSMISTYIDTTGRDFKDDITAPIHNDIMIAKDYLGNAMLLEFNYSALGDWKVGQGYQIKLDNARDLTIVGGQLPADTEIELPAGWFMIAYLRTTAANAMAAFQPLIDDNNLAIAKDYMGNAVMPEWGFNGIGDLVPGQGYQVKTEFATTFQYLPNNQSY